MSHRYECTSPSDTPDIATIVASLQHHSTYIIDLTNLHDDIVTEERIRSLKTHYSSQLPEDHTVFRSNAKALSIRKVIAREQFMMRQDHFVEAISQFSRTATRLMTQLAEELKIDRSFLSDPYAYSHINEDILEGILSEEWSYSLHGSHYHFYNSTTSQTLEVMTGFENRYDALDPYFFHQYLSSTQEYKELANVLQHGFHDMARVFDILEEVGRLQTIEEKRGDQVISGLFLDLTPK